MDKLALIYCFNEINQLKDNFQNRKQERKKERILKKMKEAVEQSENYINPKDYIRARQPKIYIKKRGR